MKKLWRYIVFFFSVSTKKDKKSIDTQLEGKEDRERDRESVREGEIEKEKRQKYKNFKSFNLHSPVKNLRNQAHMYIAGDTEGGKSMTSSMTQKNITHQVWDIKHYTKVNL